MGLIISRQELPIQTAVAAAGERAPMSVAASESRLRVKIAAAIVDSRECVLGDRLTRACWVAGLLGCWFARC